MVTAESQALGPKYDTGKLRFSLLPKGVVFEIIKVLEFGAKKYKEESWQDVPDAVRRYTDAVHRHLEAWENGEQIDPESGLHHLSHIGCNILFLIWFVVKGPHVSRN